MAHECRHEQGRPSDRLLQSRLPVISWTGIRPLRSIILIGAVTFVNR